jgi:hypothetical protein
LTDRQDHDRNVAVAGALIGGAAYSAAWAAGQAMTPGQAVDFALSDDRPVA